MGLAPDLLGLSTTFIGQFWLRIAEMLPPRAGLRLPHFSSLTAIGWLFAIILHPNSPAERVTEQVD
jgi:hypothetical protein